MKKTLSIAIALLALLAAPLRAAEPVVEVYDVTSTSYIYCSTSDLRQGNAFLKTTGSTTTVTAVSGTPFASLAVLDEITVIPGVSATPVVRHLTAKASSTSVTISGAAVNWSNGGDGYAFTWRHVACGTTAADGWVSVTPGATKTLQLIVATINAASIEISVEGRITATSSVPTPLLLPISYTATGSEFVTIPEAVDSVRVGWKVTTDAGAQSVSALLEESN